MKWQRGGAGSGWELSYAGHFPGRRATRNSKEIGLLVWDATEGGEREEDKERPEEEFGAGSISRSQV